MSCVIKTDCCSLDTAFSRAANLANDLAELASERDDRQLARLATDAYQFAEHLRGTAELLAIIAGASNPGQQR